MKLELEIAMAPPSVNSFYKHHGHRIYISPKGREFKEYVESYLIEYMNKWKIKPIKGLVEIFFEFHFRGKRNRDTSNYIKPVEDMVKDILFGDDVEVKRLHAEKFIDVEENKCLIKVITYENDNKEN